MYFLRKLTNNSTGGVLNASRSYSGKNLWSINRTFKNPVNWAAEISRLAHDFNLSATIDRKTKVVTVRPICGENRGYIKINAGYDSYRGVYLELLNELITKDYEFVDKSLVEKLISGELDGAADAPVLPVSHAENSTYYILKTQGDAAGTCFVKPLRAAPYSEAKKLGYDTLRGDLTRGHSTGLTVNQCTCGRCWIGYNYSAVTYGRRPSEWKTCGCMERVIKVTHSPRDKMFAAWREYCTMKLASYDAQTDMYKLLTASHCSVEDNLPDFSEFKEWFSRETKGKTNLFVERRDLLAPFELKNLYIPQYRHLLFDPGDDKIFKLAL